jgi:hypothetical protein
MHTDSLIEILAILDLSTLQKISSKNKRLFDIYNCDHFWRMKMRNEHLLGLDYLIDPLYFNSASKEIYEQHEKYQRRFDILSNELRRHGLNHCYREYIEEHTLSRRLLDQRDDIKTLSICKNNLIYEVPYPNKGIVVTIADYVTSKFHNLIYLDVSREYLWLSRQDVENLKRILDHPSIIFVNIYYIFIKLFDDSSLNERQLRKLIWIPECNLEEHLQGYIPNSMNHMKDEIITWHRQFYAIIKPYIADDIDSNESDRE